MKRCPKCNRQYPDDSLKFCLEDGTSLVSTRDAEPPPTEVLPPPRQTATPSEPTLVAYSRPEFARVPAVETRRTHPIVIAGVVAIVLLLTTLVAIAAIYVIQHSGNTNSNQANAESPTPRRPSPDPSKSRRGEFTPAPSPNGPAFTINSTTPSAR